MSKVWQRCKYLFNKRWMSTCNQPTSQQQSTTKSFCHSFMPTMNELPGPCGGWIGRYYQKERSYNKYMYTGIGFVMLSLAALVHTKGAWYGQNFQHICGFQYHDTARPPSKTKKKKKLSAKAVKREQIKQCGIEEKSWVPFTVISLMFTVASLVKFLL